MSTLPATVAELVTEHDELVTTIIVPDEPEMVGQLIVDQVKAYELVLGRRSPVRLVLNPTEGEGTGLIANAAKGSALVLVCSAAVAAALTLVGKRWSPRRSLKVVLLVGAEQ